MLEGAGIAVDTTRPLGRRLLTNPVVMTFFFLVVTMLIFTIAAPGKFGTRDNIEQLALNVAILTVVSVGTTFVIATAGIAWCFALNAVSYLSVLIGLYMIHLAPHVERVRRPGGSGDTARSDVARRAARSRGLAGRGRHHSP